MCGIAGYSLASASDVDRTLAAQALLAAIAERGADAVGYAHRAPDGPLVVHKQRSGASQLLEQIALPPDATEALLHVRDYTKGHPRIDANNHPVRHGAVVGIHNGIIFNDDAIMAEHGFERAQPRMTVDSEAIFALAEAFEADPHAFEQCHGSMAVAWLDERRPGIVFLARGAGRPLWIGTARGEAYFASTREALEIVERYARRRLRKRELPEGTMVALEQGREIARRQFTPDRSFYEEPLPAVRAPHEGQASLKLLARLATI